MGPVAAIGMGLNVIGGIGNIFASARANKKLNQLAASNPMYTANPVVQQRHALAKQLLNARMPGAAALERNIYGNQAATMAEVGRNATSGAQAIAAAAGVQAMTGDQFNQLQLQEGQDYYNRLNNLNQAQQGVINEGDKVYQDQVRRFEDLARIRGAQNQNTFNSWQTVSNLGSSATNFGMQQDYMKQNPFGQGAK